MKMFALICAGLGVGVLVTAGGRADDLNNPNNPNNPNNSNKPTTVSSEGVSLTIYNRDFAVVRDRISLNLEKGVNLVTYDGATTTLEPDSVVLSGGGIEILEQGYRQDVASPSALLKAFEGQNIDFLQSFEDGGQRVIQGKIIRAGGSEPLIETEGKLRFGLPGTPLFPSLGEESLLRPALEWTLLADESLAAKATVSYLTRGLGWRASYNLVSPEKGDLSTLVGWITMENNSGRDYREAKIKLLAGEVNKVRQEFALPRGGNDMMMEAVGAAPEVTQKAFDEFHLYTLPRTTTLRDRETKQVEFVRAEGVEVKTLYRLAGQTLYWGGSSIQTDPDVTMGPAGKIKVLRKIENTKENGLGIPLPMGTFRLYRENHDGEKTDLEFVGENTIDHTPKDESIEIETGEAFDLVAERTRTDFRVSGLGYNSGRIEEEFSIKLKNRKEQDVAINVVEYLRGPNGKIVQESLPSSKTSAAEIHWDVPVPAGQEVTLTYSVLYSW